MSTVTLPIQAVAAINPPQPRDLSSDLQRRVGFVPMANVGEDGTLRSIDTRAVGELLTGYTYFADGDVIVAKITPCLQNGKAALVSGLPGGHGFGSTEFHVLRAGPKLDKRYLFYMVWSPDFRRFGEQRFTGSAGQKRMPASAVAEFAIPIPFPDDARRSLAEQKRIAAILDKADAIRRRRQSVPQQYRDLIVSQFDEAFGDPIRNTRGFPTKPLEELVGSERPISYGILMPGPDTPGGVPYVRVAEMRDERLILESIRRTTPEIHAQYRRSTIRPGDILLSIRGHVGRLAMVPKALDGGNITQDTARLAIKDPDLAVYVFWLLDSPYTQRWMQGYVRGVAVKGINLGDVKRLPIMLPSPKAITQFAKFARTAFDGQDEAIAVSKHSGDLFNALVQRAFRGEL